MHLKRVGVVALIFVASPARADEATAREAFRRAQELANASPPRLAEACPLYEASYRADPQIGVLLFLADCHETIGRLASAWSEFNDAVELAHRRQDDREAIARSRADALAPRLSRLHVVAPARPMPGLVVKRDGIDITLLVGTDIAIDPGPHSIVASAPGHVDWTTAVTIGGIGVTRLDVPALVAAATPALPPNNGTLTIRSQPDAEIQIDSQHVGVGTYTGNLKRGGHTVRVVAPNKRPYQSEVTVTAGDSRTIDVMLETTGPAPAAPRHASVGFELIGGIYSPSPVVVSQSPFLEVTNQVGPLVGVGVFFDRPVLAASHVHLGLRARYFRSSWNTDSCAASQMCPSKVSAKYVGPTITLEPALYQHGSFDVHAFLAFSFGFPIGSGDLSFSNGAPAQELSLNPLLEPEAGFGMRFGQVSVHAVFQLNLVEFAHRENNSFGDPDLGRTVGITLAASWTLPR